MRRLVAALVVAGLAPTAASADTQRCFWANFSRDYEAMLRDCRAPAEDGDTRAQVSLGIALASGPERSYEDANRWWRLAAVQGDPIARDQT